MEGNFISEIRKACEYFGSGKQIEIESKLKQNARPSNNSGESPIITRQFAFSFWNTLYQYLIKKEVKYTIVSIVDCYYDYISSRDENEAIRNNLITLIRVRKRQTQDKTEWIKKSKKIISNNLGYFDVSVSKEEPFDGSLYTEDDLTSYRKTKRYSFIDGDFSIDLSVVEFFEKGKSPRKSFEAEIEATDYGNCKESYLKELLIKSEFYSSVARENLVPYTQSELDAFTFEVNRTLGGNYKVNGKNVYVDRSLMENLEPITKHQLQIGQIVGRNSYGKDIEYCMSYKADGERRLLVTGISGTWLVYPPHIYSKLSSLNLTKGLSVFDCEYIPEESIYDETIKGRYARYLLLFDCLYYEGTDVRGSSYLERLLGKKIGKSAKNFSDRMKQEHINVKQRLQMKDGDLRALQNVNKSDETLDEFLDIVKISYKNSTKIDYLDKGTKIFFSETSKAFELLETKHPDYKTDGLVFTPNEVSYPKKIMSHPEKVKYREDNFPIYKWKPRAQITIDFEIDLENKMLLMTSSDQTKKGVLVPFKGDQDKGILFNWEQYIIDAELKGYNNHSIVEFEPVFDEDGRFKRFTPIKLRSDKSGPNTSKTAISNWNQIFDTIDEDTIKGNSYNLVKFFHLRIKNSLFFKYHHKNKSTFSTHCLLDLGSGNGADIGRWIKSDFKVVIAVEYDEDRYNELVRRCKFGVKNINYIDGRRDNLSDFLIDQSKTNIVCLNASMFEHELIISVCKKITDGAMAKTISLMDVATFFWESDQTLEDIYKTISGCISKNGYVIYKMLDGQAVRAKLDPYNGNRKFNQISIEKGDLQTETIYSITAERNEDGSLTDSVIVNIPGYNKNQKEYLTNIRELTKMLGGVDLRETPKSLNIKDIKNFVRDDIVGISDMYIYGAIVFGANISLPDSQNISQLYFEWKRNMSFLALNDDKEYKSILERFLISNENVPWKETMDKFTYEIEEKNIQINPEEFNKILYSNNDQTEVYEIAIGDDFVKYGDFIGKIPKERLDLLKQKGTPNQIVEMALYYASLLSSGQQWSVSQQDYDKYYTRYSITLEAFASPLNSKLMKYNVPFCSIKFELDKYFGSKGSIFNYIPQEGEVIMANPPFIESIMKKFIERVEYWLKNILSLTVIFLAPAWSDSDFYLHLNHLSQYYHIKVEDYRGKLSKIVDNKTYEFRPNFPLKVWIIEKNISK